MSSILEELRMEKMIQASGNLNFSNAGAASEISKDFIAKYRSAQASGGDASILEAMRAKNMHNTTTNLGFDNSLATSDISREYIQKYKDSQAGAAAKPTSILEGLRKKSMDKMK